MRNALAHLVLTIACVLLVGALLLSLYGHLSQVISGALA